MFCRRVILNSKHGRSTWYSSGTSSFAISKIQHLDTLHDIHKKVYIIRASSSLQKHESTSQNQQLLVTISDEQINETEAKTTSVRRIDKVTGDRFMATRNQNYELLATKINDKSKKHDSIMDLYRTLIDKEIGTFQYPSDFTVTSKKIIYFFIHFNTAATKELLSLNKGNSLPINAATNKTITSTFTAEEQQSHVEMTMLSLMCRGMNAAFHLLERTIQEYMIIILNNNTSDLRKNTIREIATSDSKDDTDSDDDFLWFCSGRIWNQLIHKWKFIALRYHNAPSSTIMSPTDVLNTVQNISSQVTKPQQQQLSPNDDNSPLKSIATLIRRSINNTNLLNNLIYVMIKQYQQESCYTAPSRIETFIDENCSLQDSELSEDGHNEPDQVNLISESSVLSLQPNIYTYSLLLQAWIDSGHPETKNNVGRIIKMIHDLYSIQRLNTRRDSKIVSKTIDNVISSHLIAQRYYCTLLEDLDQVEALFLHLQSIDEIFNNVSVLTEMIASYCKFATRNTIPTSPKNGLTKKQLREEQDACCAKAADTFDILLNTITTKYNRTFNRMLPIPRNEITDESINILMNHALDIMKVYHTISMSYGERTKNNDMKRVVVIPEVIDRNESHDQSEVHTVTKAEQLIKQMVPYMQLNPALFRKLQLTMLKIYASANQVESALSLFEEMKQSDVSNVDKSVYVALIDMYGNINKPERAERLVRTMLQNRSERNMVDIETINSLLAAWESCTTCNAIVAADHVLQIYRLIFDHPICSKLNLKPTTETYTLLFQCMAKANTKYKGVGRKSHQNEYMATNIGSKVEELLDDMEQLYKSNDLDCCKPDTDIYNTAINACLNCKDYNEAEALLKKMESRMAIQQQQANIATMNHLAVPNMETYVSFLKCYSSIGTWVGAAWAEQLHNHMKKMSHQYPLFSHTIRPTVITYNMVMMGWLSCNTPDATDRIWKIYEQMIHVDRMQLDAYNYTTILSALSKSNSSADIQRSIEILQLMQIKANNDNQPDVHPDGRHYCMVLNGCVRMNDIDNAAHVMNMFVDAYFMKKCRSSDHPDQKIFDWMILQWIEQNELIIATWFLIDTITANVKHNKNTADTIIGPKYETIIKLYDAWIVSDHIERMKYMSKIKTFVFDRVPSFHKRMYEK